MSENEDTNPAVQAGSANKGKNGGRQPVRIILGVLIALVIYFLSRKTPSLKNSVADNPLPTATVAAAEQPVSVPKVDEQPALATEKSIAPTQPVAPKAQANIQPATSVQATTTTTSAVTVQAQPAKTTPQTAQKTRVFKARWHKANLERHWEKHHAEFPEYHSAKEYGDAALELFEYPPPGTLRKQKQNGDRLFYHPPSNRFGVTAEDGTPKTMFKPDRGIQYWNKQ